MFYCLDYLNKIYLLLKKKNRFIFSLISSKIKKKKKKKTLNIFKTWYALRGRLEAFSP